MALQEYISRVKRLGSNDAVSSHNINKVIDELQHNIDLLYSKIDSSNLNWSTAQKIYGNMMDIDSSGQSILVNGGKLDSSEKVNVFTASTGTIGYENNSFMNQEHWLRWSIGSGESKSFLVRNIPVPEEIRHQSYLIAFKMIVYEGSTEKNETWNIYVNNSLVGTGMTESITDENSDDLVKTVFGVYNSTGNESNLEVVLKRSSTNSVTGSDYVARICNAYVGLNTSGYTAGQLNYPITLFPSSLGTYIDASDFFDFENNSIRPTPLFLTRSLVTFANLIP
jgi:hypothetical protein